MKRARIQTGSVVLDKRINKWNFYWRENGKRRSKVVGSTRDYPTKASAWKAAQPLRQMVENQTKVCTAPTVKALVVQYRDEKMPTRFSTRQAYESWFKNRILPQFGEQSITELQPRPVERWLSSLELSPKSKGHIRGLLHALWDYAMWSGAIPVQVNPISLVTVKGSSLRMRKPRSLTVEEFHLFLERLEEPFRTIALVCVCFGLRISECLALKWNDVDWLNGRVTVERGIVKQRVDTVKTANSERRMTIEGDLLSVFTTWKQTTRFSDASDWIFASPAKAGRQPWSYDQVLRAFKAAGEATGIGKVTTHSMRHTYRSWLDAVGTPVGVQQKLMRHADIRTTMNVYGDVVTDEMSQANLKVVGLALNGR